MFLRYFVIALYILILEVITKIFNSVVQLAISTEIPTKEAKAEMETHPVIVKIKISEWSL